MLYIVNKHTKEHRRYIDAEEWADADCVVVGADPDGWIEWQGGECPLPDGALHEVKFRDGQVFEGCMGPEDWYWHHLGVKSDIIAYRPSPEDKPQVPKECVTVRYDLSPAGVDGAVRDTLIGMGWAPPQDKAPSWDGEGLPPVGVECEFQYLPGDWFGAKVIGYDGPACVVAIDGGEYEGSDNPRDFRPIRTAKGRTLDEMEAIARNGQVMMPGTRKACERLYEAGYRLT